MIVVLDGGDNGIQEDTNHIVFMHQLKVKIAMYKI